jgi:tRNA A-37 threonylcarbamoyl transferase component Bud32
VAIEGLLAGRVLCDRYRIDAVIGRGGMGVVYRARDLRLERPVAAKVITAGSGDLAARGHLRERFQREARAIAQLQHPNVVALFDSGTDPELDLDFLILELLQGEDLAALLSRVARLPVGLAVEILLQASRGLTAGHRLGVVHRDVKPANLFLRDAGDGGIRVAVLDFGIAKLADPANDSTLTQLTVFGRAPHSPAYAAPEQLRGDARIDAASDVWALGVTGFQMLTGEKPYDDAGLRRLMEGFAVRAPSARRRNPAVPESLDEVLRTALAEHPYDRYRDACELGRALDEVAREIGTGDLEDRTGRSASHAAARGAGAPTAHRWRSPFHLPQTEPVGADADHTRLLEAAAPAAVALLPQPAPYPFPATAQPGGPLSPAEPSARGPGWFGRFLGGVWNLTLTLASLGLAVAFGSVVLTAQERGDVDSFYAALVGMTAALPWAVHRLMGRRGSYLAALLASGATAFGGLRYLAPEIGVETTILLIPVGQLVAAAWLLRLTRRFRSPASPEHAG